MTEQKVETIAFSPQLACTSSRNGKMCGKLAYSGIAALRHDEKSDSNFWILQTICQECLTLFEKLYTDEMTK